MGKASTKSFDQRETDAQRDRSRDTEKQRRWERQTQRNRDNIFPLAYNVSFWKQKLTFHVNFWLLKLTFCISFWPQKLIHYVSFWIQRFLSQRLMFCQFLDPETIIMDQLQPEMTFSGSRNWNIYNIFLENKNLKIASCSDIYYNIPLMLLWDSCPKKLKSNKCLSKRHFSQVELVFIAFNGSDRLGGNAVLTLGRLATTLACFVLGTENDINLKADIHSGSNLLERNINWLKRLSWIVQQFCFVSF